MSLEEINELKKKINELIFSSNNNQLNIFTLINLRYALVIFHAEIKALNNNDRNYVLNYQKCWKEVTDIDMNPSKALANKKSISLGESLAYLHALVSVYEFELSSMKKMDVYYG